MDKRATGRTTRLVDWYIQELFKWEEVEIVDHHPNSYTNRFLTETIAKRIRHEHPHIKLNVRYEGGDIYMKMEKYSF